MTFSLLAPSHLLYNCLWGYYTNSYTLCVFFFLTNDKVRKISIVSISQSKQIYFLKLSFYSLDCYFTYDRADVFEYSNHLINKCIRTFSLIYVHLTILCYIVWKRNNDMLNEVYFVHIMFIFSIFINILLKKLTLD